MRGRLFLCGGRVRGLCGFGNGPDVEGKVDGTIESVARVAAAGLHGKSVHHADDEQGKRRDVGGGGKVAIAAGAFETVAHLGDATLADGCHLLADGFAFGAGDERALHPEATAGIRSVGGHCHSAAEQHLRHLAGPRLAESAADVPPGTGAVACDGLAEETGFVAERRVKARAIDPHGRGQRGE